MSLSKGGLRVGVKDLETESYVDKTRGVLVNAWYLSTWPAYKSKLWNKLPPGAAGGTGPDGARERKPYVLRSYFPARTFINSLCLKLEARRSVSQSALASLVFMLKPHPAAT